MALGTHGVNHVYLFASAGQKISKIQIILRYKQ